LLKIKIKICCHPTIFPFEDGVRGIDIDNEHVIKTKFGFLNLGVFLNI